MSVSTLSVTDPDGLRTYPYPPTGEDLDSVTTVISGTQNKPWIAKWHGTTSTKWAVDNLGLLARTKRTEGRDAAVRMGRDAAERLRAVKSDAGVYVHDVQQSLILWAASPEGTGAEIALPLLPEHLEGALYHLGGDEYVPLDEVVDAMVDGFVSFVRQFNPRFLATEMTVYNQPLGIAGTLDMIIELDGYAISHGTGPRGADEIVASPGNLLVICVDTKTGKNAEGTWKEQLAAYRRMLECLLPLGEIRSLPRTHCGAVLHLRPDYPDGFCLMLVSAADDELAWRRFERAVSVYRERQEVKDRPGPAIRPLRADGTMPGVRLCDVAGEGYGRALNPLRKALGPRTELADVARFTAADVLAVKGVGPKLIDEIRRMLADHRLCLAGEELAPVLAVVRETAEQEAA